MSSKTAKTQPSDEQRTLAHIERMLLRARKRAARAEKLVLQWERRLAETRRAPLFENQTDLWPDSK